MPRQASAPSQSDQPLSFGGWLKWQRKVLDLTQDQLAQRAGCARVTIRKIETNEMRPSRQMAELLARALAISVTERATFVEFARGVLTLEEWRPQQNGPIPAADREAFVAAARGAEWDEPHSALASIDRPTHNNLPMQLTSFIGRESEIVEVRRLLAETRLLTLMGAGGVGKTRLTLQVAAEELGTYSDGVWLAELAPLADPALIASTIASAVGVREEPNRPILATLGDHFRDSCALIVLDNCEHLIADAAQVCDNLLHAAPRLTIIATSREALGIGGETAYRVPSLDIPADAMPLDALSHVASVRLFTERSASAKTDFALTTANASAVAQICRRLDGIPLAIELAAARVRSMTAEQIAARLDDRFRILTGGSRTALPRQQTLRALIDWSYRLLTEPEKTLLSRLSVFAGGWTLEAAESVCSGHGLEAQNILDLLTHLVDRSLVVLDESSDEPRYQMLETIRQFAREALAGTEEGSRIRDVHLRYYVTLLETAADAWFGQKIPQRSTLSRVRQELDNLRGALTWATNSNVELGLQLASVFNGAWHHLGYGNEIYEWNCDFLQRSAKDATPARAWALAYLGWYESAFLDDVEQSLSHYRDSIAIWIALGDQRGLALSLLSSSTALVVTDPIQAHNHVAEGLRLAEAIGDPILIATAHLRMGELWRQQGDDARAEKHYQRSLNLSRSTHAELRVGTILNTLAFIALHRNDLRLARMYILEALSHIAGMDLPGIVADSLTALAGVSALQQETLVSARLFGATAAIFERTNTRRQRIDRADFDRYLALARSQADPSAFEAAFATGRAMSYDEAIAYAMEVLHG
ncbi:MAG: helix-turn-helix domain-containing protein [Chloroflexi bacterium]|nr:helix-turn-helix domain-containing protein [Chloroflexota bacterium]